MESSVKKSLCALSGVALVAALVLPVSALGAPVTIVVKAQVDLIVNDVKTNGQLVGPAVNDASIPLKVGDELRLILTYDSALGGTLATSCGGGDGRYDFMATSTSISLYSDRYIAANSAATVSILTGCGQIHDTFSASPTLLPSGAPIEALALNGINPQLALDPSCFGPSPSLPVGGLGSGSCSLYGGSIVLNWNSFTLPSTFARVEVHARKNVSVALPTCSDLIAQLAADVFRLNLQKGVNNSLDAKLDAAIKAADGTSSNNNVTAINQLSAFLNAVSAQRGNYIGQGEADALSIMANGIIACLSS